MTWEVTLRLEARQDVWSAANWYESQQRELGQRFLNEILVARSKVAEQPLIYSIIHKNIRRIIVKRFPFAIYYIIKGQSVIIIAVLHMRRNPEIWKKRSLG